MNDNVSCEKLKDESGKIICDEFYYQFYENKDFNLIWTNGLKKVFDSQDKTGEYSIEKAIEYMDDEQELMLFIINDLIANKIEGESLDYIYINYLLNEDGSINLLKQIMVVYQLNNSHLVIRIPFYSITNYGIEKYTKLMKEN